MVYCQHLVLILNLYKMRKIIFVNLIAVFFIINIADAQINSEVKGVFSMPFGNNKIVDYGTGLNFNIGYLIKNKLDFSIGAEKIWCASIIDGYKISSIQANLKYFVFTKDIKPYIGFGIGNFQESFNQPFGNDFKESGIGIIPSIGSLFKSKIKGLFFDAELSGYKVYKNHPISIININIGVLYYFRLKVERK